MGASLHVHFDEVHKRFKRGDQEISVVEGINIDVEPGEFVALMGPSGSGKSTLLNLVAGLDKPSSGRVTVGNFEPATMSDTQVCHWRSRHIGFIFQRYHLIGVFDAASNVEVPLLLFGLSRSERQRRVKTALELVGLADRDKHYPRQLSGGQEQRVAIARAIVTDPTILLADEPTGDLDAASASDILDLLGMLSETMKKTIIMVTHDPSAAKRAQRLLHLEKGSIYQS
jgi:putative ABC transport system ATP-binding protein